MSEAKRARLVDTNGGEFSFEFRWDGVDFAEGVNLTVKNGHFEGGDSTVEGVIEAVADKLLEYAAYLRACPERRQFSPIAKAVHESLALSVEH